jgi:hypothetical protein
MTTLAPTRRSFSVSKHIIIQLIAAQSGSLGKALMETIMNGIDAGATRIDITLDRKGYIVQDNGTGFQSYEEIEAYFAVFGFDHATEAEAGKRLYGEFGIGRGQQWNFARTTWRTRTFEMHVDIRANGLDYDLHESLADEPGTTITGTFYEPLNTGEVHQHVKHLSDLVKYSPVPVFVNGKQVSTHPDTLTTWTHVTDEAWILSKEHGGLKVYNMGMFVAELTHNVGCSGIVVTKPGHALQLNMARNDILTTPEGLWRRLKAKLKQIGEERVRSSATRLTEADLRLFAQKVVTLEADYVDFEKLKLFTDATGKALTLGKLVASLKTTGILTVHSPAHASLSRRAMDNRLATVLDARTLERWDVETVRELHEILVRYLQQAVHFKLMDAFEPLRILQRAQSEDNITLAVPTLRGFYTLSESPKGYPLAVLKGLRGMSGELQTVVWRSQWDPEDPHRRPRPPELKILPGQSDVADVWTDKKGYLAVHDDRLVHAKTVGQVERLILGLLGLLLQGKNSMTEAPDETADETLMRFLRAEPHLTEWTLKAVQGIVTACAEQDTKVPQQLLHLLGRAEDLEPAESAHSA